MKKSSHENTKSFGKNSKKFNNSFEEKKNILNETNIEKKRSRGRKVMDPQIDQDISDWVQSQLNMGIIVTQKNIRKKAKTLSCSKDFKASKGWLEKFFKRKP